MSVSRPEKELLEKLCQKPETLKRALEILRIAKTKTAPGSGHELKSNVGLPAICALIASDELNNGDVGRKEAQQASSISQADFKRSHTTVQSVLQTVDPPEPTGLTDYYRLLIKKTKSSVPVDIFLRWVERAERSLMLMQNEIDLNREDVSCAIFLWVYSLILEDNPMTLDKFVRAHKLSSRQLGRVRKLLESTSHSKQILEELERVQQGLPATPSASPRKSPEKKRRVVPVSPQKRQDADSKAAEPTDSPRKSARIAASSPQKQTEPTDPPAEKSAKTTAKSSSQKYQLDDDTDTEPIDTPTRKSARIAASTTTQASLSKAEATKRPPADASPSKRVTRASDRIPPATNSPRKRKYDELFSDPESPSKRARPARSQPVASSSRVTLDRPPPRTPTKPSLKGSSRTPSPQKRVRMATSVVASPTKPRMRAARRPSESKAMDADETSSVLTDEEEEEEEREPPPRRYRPVFVAFKQWNARDPKVEARMKRAEKYHKDMVARYGHPFEHLRPIPVAAT